MRCGIDFDVDAVATVGVGDVLGHAVEVAKARPGTHDAGKVTTKVVSHTSLLPKLVLELSPVSEPGGPEKWVGSSASYVSPRAAGQTDAWTEELAVNGRQGSQLLREVAEVVPPLLVAGALRLPEGETAVVRRRVMLVDERPVELTDSYYPLSVAAGTGLAAARKIPGGAPTLLAQLGHVPSEVIEDLTVRPATAAEAEALGLEEGAPVILLVRLVRSADGVPFEVSVMTMVPEGRHFRYSLKVG
ncbi:GntR family transcriptional regulator [Planotetraspora sp. GP83]|uniref:GntR family transcriptional regulator n=1 Tax=Planotetraspora sp. GP83 TaxID=3156264 RepID=UPI0035125931